jgi:ribulose-bisphosphate carboxylase large chain
LTRFTAIYRIRSDAAGIAARARSIAVEQSVEMPVEAIEDAGVLADVVGRVDDIADQGDGVFAVRIALAASTVEDDAGQLLNMLFGNASLHEDVVLADMELPDAMLAGFAAGPGHGIAGLRSRASATGRALTCAAIKPQGLPPAALAALTGRFAAGGVDFIKDDHGLADQRAAPFAERVAACAAAVRAAGTGARYVPSLSGDLDRLRREVRLAREAGVDTVMVAPMVAGFAAVRTLVRENPDLAFMAHPTMGGAARIAPELLIGKLFRLLGADAVVFPTYGGRFGYSARTCAALAANARGAWGGMPGSAPVPAGGMTLARVAEQLDFYGPETMLLIGGSLLLARERLTEATAAFTRTVAHHPYG